MNKDNDKIIKQSLDIKNEVLKIIYSINSLKNVENDLEVSFHFVDNDEEINAINTVINSAVKDVNQLVPLREDDIKAFTPIYDIFRNCWLFPTAKLENGIYGFSFVQEKDMAVAEIIPFVDGRFYSIDINQLFVNESEVN